MSVLLGNGGITAGSTPISTLAQLNLRIKSFYPIPYLCLTFETCHFITFAYAIESYSCKFFRSNVWYMSIFKTLKPCCFKTINNIIYFFARMLQQLAMINIHLLEGLKFVTFPKSSVL